MIKETKFLIKTVKDAAKLITEDFVVKAKDDKGDLVTNFDFEIENFIINKIKQRYPSFDIVSEEFNSKKELTNNCFVIDPIDGTINFAHNLPLWGIQVACVKEGEVVSSVIYLPKLKEMYYADESGAFLNKKPIHIFDRPQNQRLIVVEGIDGDASRIRVKSSGVGIRYYGVACVSSSWVACGKLSAFVFNVNNYWDYIPGQFLIKQAGGYVIDNDCCHIAASSKELAELLAKVCVPYPDDDVMLKHN